MRNSDKFYEVSLNFQNQRKLTVDKFEKRMRELEKAKGSKLYTDESRAAEEEKNTKLKALQTNYLSEIKDVFADMRKINNSRKMTPPTQEQLAILSALKLREHLSSDDIISAANSLSDNRFCLSVLDEIAHKNGIVGCNVMSFAKSDSFTIGEVENIISSAEKSIKDFIEFDTADSVRRIATQRAEHYGNAYQLPKRKLFETKEECFISLCGLSESNWMDFEFCVDEHENS